METTTSSYQTTLQTQPSVWSVGVKGGLYTGLIMVLYNLLSYITEVRALQEAATLFLFISTLIGICLTHKAFKDQGNSYMSYGQGLGLASVLGLVAGLLSGVVAFVYLAFIDNAYITRQMEMLRIEYENAGLSDAQIDQSMQIMEYVMTPGALFFMSIIMTIFFAFLISLVVSAFTKNTDPSLEY